MTEHVGSTSSTDEGRSTAEGTAVRYERDADGIVTLVLDDPTAGANTMNELYQRSMHEAVDRLHAEADEITGVVITSAKKTFFAGGNLTRMMQATPDDAASVFADVEAMKADLRRLERLGRPVVAAINGAALGGGYEIALACHHRVALDTPGTKVGCPEVTLGLLPGGGGITRTVRMLGITDALLKVLLQGTRYSARRALDNGLVDELRLFVLPRVLGVGQRLFEGLTTAQRLTLARGESFDGGIQHLVYEVDPQR